MVIATGEQALAADVLAIGMLPESHLNISDDFITGGLEDGEVGALGWNFVADAIAHSASLANHPGILYVQTSAVANNRAYLYPIAQNANLLVFDDLWELTFIIYLPAVTDIKIFVGAINAVASPTTNQDRAGFEFDTAADTFWMMCTGSGAAETRTATDITPGAAWYKLKIVRVATGFEFYIDDVLKGTLTTTLPDTPINYGISLETLAAVNKIFQTDFFHLDLAGITR